MSHFNQLIELDQQQITASSTNSISATDFLDLNKALVNILNEKNITLSELGDHSPVVTFNQPDASLLDLNDYINYDKTEPDELKLFYKNQLTENLIGTDFYYLSTDSQNQTISGKYISAQNKAYNYFNINNATTYSIPVSSRMFEKDIGGFFLPVKYSILRTIGRYDFYLKDNLERDTIYSFPHPNVQGNISGLINHHYLHHLILYQTIGTLKTYLLHMVGEGSTVIIEIKIFIHMIQLNKKE